MLGETTLCVVLGPVLRRGSSLGLMVAQLPWKLSPDECRLKVAYRLSDMGHSACLMAWHGRCCAG